MKKMMTYFILSLFLGSAVLFACSNNNDPEPQKGAIEEMTDKAAKAAVKKIRTPLNKARSAADQQEDRLDDMDESLK